MRNIINAIFLVCGLSFATLCEAQTGSSSSEELRSLDDQVQEIKTDVLAIAADLNRLEEKLLYPSGTELAVFVSIAEGRVFRLDSVQIDIDGRPATRYIYGFKELEALQKGGAQRIYTGNVAAGAHEMRVTVSGKTQGGDDFNHEQVFAFEKSIEPKLLGLQLDGPQALELGEW